jgi:8-oxo-dGTP diphosphatase
MLMKKTTICYIENNGSWLMLYRNRKKDDMNEGKWISPGGKMEEGETPDECALREVLEETGLRLRSWTFHGVIEFRSDEYEDEDMYLYSSSDFVPDDEEAARRFAETGRYEPPECREGELVWVPHEKMLELPAWEGDRAFLTELLAGVKDINMTLQYTGEHCTIIRK